MFLKILQLSCVLAPTKVNRIWPGFRLGEDFGLVRGPYVPEVLSPMFFPFVFTTVPL
jgi:hypothetical protein